MGKLRAGLVGLLSAATLYGSGCGATPNNTLCFLLGRLGEPFCTTETVIPEPQPEPVRPECCTARAAPREGVFEVTYLYENGSSSTAKVRVSNHALIWGETGRGTTYHISGGAVSFANTDIEDEPCIIPPNCYYDSCHCPDSGKVLRLCFDTPETLNGFLLYTHYCGTASKTLITGKWLLELPAEEKAAECCKAEAVTPRDGKYYVEYQSVYGVFPGGSSSSFYLLASQGKVTMPFNDKEHIVNDHGTFEFRDLYIEDDCFENPLEGHRSGYDCVYPTKWYGVHGCITSPETITGFEFYNKSCDMVAKRLFEAQWVADLDK